MDWRTIDEISRERDEARKWARIWKRAAKLWRKDNNETIEYYKQIFLYASKELREARAEYDKLSQRVRYSADGTLVINTHGIDTFMIEDYAPPSRQD